jgi:hypothetical protein
MVPTVERGLPAGGLLVDRDRRRQALDEVDVGLVHLPEELAGVGRQRLDVAPLALGEDRVEGEAGLAGPGQPGEDDEGVARQVERDVLEVVLARTAHDEAVGHQVLRDRARRLSGEIRRAEPEAGKAGSPTLTSGPDSFLPRTV